MMRIPSLAGTRFNESFSSTIKGRAGIATNQIYGGFKILNGFNEKT
jgi:hypothetical protein